MAGKIQNEDIKSLAELTGLGGVASSLINDSKIYVTAKSINKQFSQAIIDGDIGGSIRTSSVQTIVGGGNATGTTTDGFQMIKVKSATLGGNTASGTPLGTAAYNDGQQFIIVGQDDDYPLTINFSDVAKGFLLNGEIVLFKGTCLTVIFDSGLNRFIEVSRNA